MIALTHVVILMVPKKFLEMADAEFELTWGWQSPEPNAKPLRQPAKNKKIRFSLFKHIASINSVANGLIKLLNCNKYQRFMR
jgi:hypothetical protein